MEKVKDEGFVVSVYWGDGAYDSIDAFKSFEKADKFAEQAAKYYEESGNVSGAVSVQVVASRYIID